MKKATKIMLVILSFCLLAVGLTAAAGAEGTDAYAVYNSADQSLTFVVGTPTEDGVERAADHQLYTGSVYSGFLTAQYDNNTTDQRTPWYDSCANITNVTFADSIAPISTAFWFSGFRSLTSINGITNLDTSNVTTMICMFSSCTSITALDLSSFETGNVTDMSGMFSSCSKLSSLNMSNWKTGNVTTMSSMFHGCSALYLDPYNLDLISWDTSKVTDMGYMFYGCSNLRSMNLNTWKTGSVTNMYHMFEGCSALTSLFLDAWDTSKVTSMHMMFYDCRALKDVGCSEWNTGNVTNMSYMFCNCWSLSYIPVAYWNTENVTNMDNMFFLNTVLYSHPSDNLKSLDLSRWDTGEVTSMYRMFEGHEALTSLNVSGWNTSKVGNMERMFWGCSALTSLDLSNWNTSNAWNMKSMFFNCSALTSLDLGNFHANRVRDMSYMFSGCSALTSLDLSSFDTGNVTTMYQTFNQCTYLVSLALGENFAFKSGASLPNYGYWVKENGDGTRYTSAELISNYNGATMAGTWVRVSVYFAIYNDANKSLTFVFGEQTNDGVVRAADSQLYTGDAYYTDFLTAQYDNSTTDQRTPWYDHRSDITKVTFADPFSPTSTAYWFSGFNSLSAVNGLQKLNTSNVTSMSHMFECRPLLQSLDVSGWNTANVTDMSDLFSGMAQLRSLDVSGWDTHNVTNMSGMFRNNTAVSSLDVKNWDTGNVTDMHDMFAGCSSITALDVSNWNTGNVTDMSHMFSGLFKLASLNVGNWDTAHVTTMAGMFLNCTALRSLNVSGWETDNVTDMSYMFHMDWYGGLPLRISALASLDVSGWKTGKVTNMSHMFYNCYSLTSLDVSHWDTGNVTDMSYMFYMYRDTSYQEQSQSKLASLDVSGWDTGKVTDMSYMFYYCYLLPSLDVSHWVTGNVTNMSGMFCSCSALTTLDVSRWDTSKVTTMGGYTIQTFPGNQIVFRNISGMFYGCSSLSSLDVSNWNTGNVTNMSYIFGNCSALTALNVSGWHTENVTNMKNMFSGCSALSSLNLSGWDTENATNMSAMFYNCTALTSLGVSGWDTGNVTDMSYMFYNCTSLTSLDLSNFVTNNVTAMNDLFRGCSFITTLDLRNFDTGNVTNMYRMFQDCTYLVSLTLGENFAFKHNASLPDYEYWRKENGDGTKYTAAELTSNYNGATMAGTWVRFGTYAIYDDTDKTLTFFEGTPTVNGVVRAANHQLYTADVYYTGFQTAQYNNSQTTPWYDHCSKITGVTFADPIAPTSTAYWFSGFNKLTAITGIEKLNTSNVTTMAGMFLNCRSLTSLDLSSFSTNNVTKLNGMFNDCRALTSLNLSNWNTGKVTTMANMFNDCRALTSLNINSWNTASVTTMQQMFNGCTVLTSLNLSNWDTGSVTTMNSMFKGCSALSSLDLRNWNTASVTTMSSMFNGCTALTSLDLSSFDTGSVTTMSSMFPGLHSVLSQLTLGENFSFKTNAGLRTPSNDPLYTGFWMRRGGDGTSYTSAQLMATYDGATMAGTWIWGRRLTTSYTTPTYSGAALTPLTVSWGDVTLTEGVDYEVQYENNVNVGTASATVSGINDYAGEVKSDTFTILPRSLAGAITDSTALTYNGAEQIPDLTVMLDGTALTEGTDFTIESIEHNVNAGMATVTVTGIGNYAEETIGTFTILPKPIADADANGEAVTYTGEAQISPLTVTLDGVTLTEGTDFTVEGYEDNINAGTAKVRLAGVGNYGGEALGTFTIQPKSLAGAEADGDDVTYTGNALTPSFTVTLDHAELTEGTDFRVESIENNVNVGTASVTIVGINNYDGEVLGSFSILARDLEDAEIDTSAQLFTGEEIKAPIRVRVDGRTLVKDVDYTVDYADNVEEGTARVIVTGIGNYEGTVFGSFEITIDDRSDSEKIVSQISLLAWIKELIQKFLAIFKRFC